jgi:dihydroorotate dehydrogenase
MIDLNSLRIGNAAGTAKTMAEFLKLLRSAATDIVMGSYTLEPLAGNTSDTGEDLFYLSAKGWSLNARGLPNLGIRAFLQDYPEMQRLAAAAGKRLIVSIAAFTIEEHIELVRLCVAAGVKYIEFNAGCPNTYTAGGKRKVIPSLDPNYLTEILSAIKRELRWPAQLTVKLSPDPDEDRLHRVAMIVRRERFIRGIVAVNTIPGVERLRDDGVTPALSYNGGMHAGGLAGSEILQDGLRVVSFMRRRIQSWQSVTGAGGISHGKHLQMHEEAGASRFQIGTRVYNFGPKVIGEVAGQYAELTETV